MLINGNLFQILVDSKIQREIVYNRLPGRLSSNGNLVTDYLQYIPFISKKENFRTTLHISMKIGKDNFINYWMRVLSLEKNMKEELEQIWNNAIDCTSGIEDFRDPILIVDNEGIISVDAMTQMIYEVSVL